MADEFERITDESLWDFANDLTDAWNIEDLNPPSLIEVFRDRFVARFGHGDTQGEPSEAQVEAAIQAFANRDGALSNPEDMRAALRAAGGLR